MKTDNLMSNIQEIDESMPKFLYNLGRLPRIAAITIQRAVRRHFFYKKIQRISLVYENMLFEKEQNTFRKIRSMLPIIFYKQIVNDLKYERMKKKKLNLIKRKLAILKIKNAFRREKMSWKIVRIRIKKYKRNLKPLTKKSTMKRNSIRTDISPSEIRQVTKNESPSDRVQAKVLKEKQVSQTKFNQTIESIEKPEINIIKSDEQFKEQKIEKTQEENSNLNIPEEGIHPSDSQETILTTTTEREAIIYAEMLRKLEEERQIKISLGKISYNIRDKEEGRFLPYLKGAFATNDIIPIVKINNEKVREIKEKSPEKNQEIKLSSKINLPAQKNQKYINGSYMRETVAYQYSRFDAQKPIVEENIQKTIRKIRNNSTLMAPTTAFIQKVAGNPSARSHSTETKTGEKIELPKPRFASIANLYIPTQTAPQSRRIPVLLIKSPKMIIKEEEIPPEPQHQAKFSLSFYDALPEFSGFLTQYSKTSRKPKLEPILLKSTKITAQEILDL